MQVKLRVIKNCWRTSTSSQKIITVKGLKFCLGWHYFLQFHVNSGTKKKTERYAIVFIVVSKFHSIWRKKKWNIQNHRRRNISGRISHLIEVFKLSQQWNQRDWTEASKLWDEDDGAFGSLRDEKDVNKTFTECSFFDGSFRYQKKNWKSLKSSREFVTIFLFVLKVLGNKMLWKHYFLDSSPEALNFYAEKIPEGSLKLFQHFFFSFSREKNLENSRSCTKL